MNGLTERERQILVHKAMGLTTVEVGRRLDLAPQTVKNTLSEAYAALKVRNIIEAFIVLGWLCPPKGES